MRIGVSWKGSSRHVDDHSRSIRLDGWKPVFATGHTFVSLQPEVTREETAILRAAGVECPVQPSWDWLATGRLILTLDLVVAVDTGVIHVAGALGVKAWMLVAHTPDWRWMQARPDTPWYASVTIYRQGTPGAWGPVLSTVARDLHELGQKAA